MFEQASIKKYSAHFFSCCHGEISDVVEGNSAFIVFAENYGHNLNPATPNSVRLNNGDAAEPSDWRFDCDQLRSSVVSG